MTYVQVPANRVPLVVSGIFNVACSVAVVIATDVAREEVNSRQYVCVTVVTWRTDVIRARARCTGCGVNCEHMWQHCTRRSGQLKSDWNCMAQTRYVTLRYVTLRYVTLRDVTLSYVTLPFGC